MKCAASLLVKSPRRFPRYLPGGTPIMVPHPSQPLLSHLAPVLSRLFNVSPQRLRAVIFLLLISTPWR